MRILKFLFENKIDLINNEWFEKFDLDSKFILNGVKIGDNEKKIRNGIVVINFQRGINEHCLVRSDNFEYNYKIINGKVVGFSRRNTANKTKNEFILKLGKPIKAEPIIGQIYNMYSFDIDGYEWLYRNKIKLVLDNKEEKVEAIHFGEELGYFEN